jgi:hypothetical protein
MVHGPACNDVTQVNVTAGFIRFELLVGGGDGVDGERREADGCAGIEANGEFEDEVEPVGDELAVGFRDDQVEAWVGGEQGFQGVGIEMIGVVVARGDHLNEIERFGCHHPLGHLDVGLVGQRIFAGQRVREIGVEQQMLSLPLEQEPALAEPPEMEVFEIGTVRGDVVEEDPGLAGTGGSWAGSWELWDGGTDGTRARVARPDSGWVCPEMGGGESRASAAPVSLLRPGS